MCIYCIYDHYITVSCMMHKMEIILPRHLSLNSERDFCIFSFGL